MKHLVPLALSLLFLASCSTENTLTEVETTSEKPLLKSYKLITDENGHLSVSYELNDDGYVEYTKGIENFNNLYIFNGENSLGNKSLNSLSTDGNEIKLGIYDNNSEVHTISIKDNFSNLSKDDVYEHPFLKSYSAEHLGDDTFLIDFNVKENVVVSFEYNTNRNAYEIHLQTGKSKTTNFSQTYKKESSTLKIIFINHTDQSSDSNVITSRKMTLPDRPIMDIGGGPYED